MTSFILFLLPILNLDLSLDTMSSTTQNDNVDTTIPELGNAEKTLFDLPAEVRNMIYGLELEDHLQHLTGDNREAIMDEERANHLAVDWRSLEQTRMPTICQVSKQIREEALSLVFSDYLPAMNVFKFGGAQYSNDCFEAWLDLYGKSIVPHLRYFLINTGACKIAVVLNGSEAEVEVLQNEEVHATGNDWEAETRAVAITHFQGQLVDENVPAWVEYAAVEIMHKLEELLPKRSTQPRLSAKKLRFLAKLCMRKLERNDGDESDEESEEENDDEQSDEEKSEDRIKEEIEQGRASWKLP